MRKWATRTMIVLEAAEEEEDPTDISDDKDFQTSLA